MNVKTKLATSYLQELIPGTGIKPVPDSSLRKWQAVKEDPQFILKGLWPNGWTEVTWSASTDRPRKLRLYFDRGRGFSDIESLHLGFVYGEEVREYHAIVPFGTDIRALRLDPGEDMGEFVLDRIMFKELSKPQVFARALKNYLAHDNQPSGFTLAKRLTRIALSSGIKGVWEWGKNSLEPAVSYEDWLMYNSYDKEYLRAIKGEITKFAYKPIFSIIVPVYNVEEQWLRKCIDSVRTQVYPYWELCIADDASTAPHVKRVLEEYRSKESRIKVVYRETNGHISVASNSALAIATGEYIALLDNDDELTPDALYENAKLLNSYPSVDMVYSDEDKIDEAGRRHDPFFKPDWAPDNFLSQMYTCHFGVYRRSLVEKIGGFRKGFEGSQDYDLVLRLTEKTDSIFHIPKILYHWRTIAGSTAANSGAKTYAFVAGEKAIQEALDRRGEGGRVESIPYHLGQYLIRYKPQGQPLISIIIPTRDMGEVLNNCLQAIFSKTTYINYEVIVVDNGSIEENTRKLFDKWKQNEPKRFRVLRMDIPFNYSVLNNQAVEQAKGEYIVLLNNDTEIITAQWLEELLGQAQRPSIGAVGACLLYPDNTIQHSGVVLGIKGVAGHGHLGYKNSVPGYFGRLKIVSNYAAVTAACLMVRKETYQQVGGLDEDLKVAFNDVDFCLKLLTNGFYNVVLPQVRLYHHESKTRGKEDTPEKLERFIGEVNLMKSRWKALIENDPFYNPNLTIEKEDFSLEVPSRVKPIQ